MIAACYEPSTACYLYQGQVTSAPATRALRRFKLLDIAWPRPNTACTRRGSGPPELVCNEGAGDDTDSALRELLGGSRCDSLPSPSRAGGIQAAPNTVRGISREEPSGKVWIGTEDQGVFRYDPSAKGAAQWTNFTAKNGLGDDNVYAICSDKLGRIWVGHLNHGVSVYNGESWKNYDVLDGPIGERIFSIASDPVTGDIWIATSAGLTRYSIDHDTWSNTTRADALPSDQIQSLAFDAHGNLYAGTQCDGLAISGPKGDYKRWSQIAGSDSLPLVPAGQGLPSNLINQVLVAPTAWCMWRRLAASPLVKTAASGGRSSAALTGPRK